MAMLDLPLPCPLGQPCGGVRFVRGPGGLQDGGAVERLGARQRLRDERTGQLRLTVLRGAAHRVLVAQVAAFQDGLDLGGRLLRRRLPAAAHPPQHPEDLRLRPLARPALRC